MKNIVLLLFLFTGNAFSQYTPFVGQPGKDVIWVPTPYALTETMLDIAKVTAQDYVIDLASGDGRNGGRMRSQWMAWLFQWPPSGEIMGCFAMAVLYSGTKP